MGLEIREFSGSSTSLVLCFLIIREIFVEHTLML